MHYGLNDIIYKTIEEHKIRYPFNDLLIVGTPFYNSTQVFDYFNQFIIFGSTTTTDDFVDLLTKDDSIIIPSKEEIESFYELFISKINQNKTLKELYFEDNYKERIFSISKIIGETKIVVDSIKEDTVVIKTLAEGMASELENKKLTSEKVIDALKKQVTRQLKKQINSGKYLPNTYIETGDQKEHLRYLCDSIFYSEKCIDEIKIMDFRYLNNFLKTKKHPEFEFDFNRLEIKRDESNFKNFVVGIEACYNYLVTKRQEIIDIKIASNEKSKFEYKFTNPIKDLEFLKSRVALITETAGQGKTNLLCDFAENFLLNRQIPTVFLTGIEINASDIRLSILKRIFPDSTDYSFQDLINVIKNVCYKQNKYFVIIIDGINENINTKLLSQNLEILIPEILEHDFIKIVLSCRTEYYQQNFYNFEKSAFKKDIQKITSIWSHHPNDDLKEKVFKIYFKYFDIKHHNITDKAYNQLVENFLLLRIFCETYQKQNLEFIDNIYKEELFDQYYSIKSEEINKRLNNNDEFKVSGTFDIKRFISNVVKFMIEERTYVNVPFDRIIENSVDRQMYIRFLDENILVKRDIQTDEGGIFSDKEVVNFTFDEFRDFIISRYLIEVIYKNSIDEFTSFIETEISMKSTLSEGCRTFLFFISRKGKEEILNEIISKQPWYSTVFSTCIFSLKDAQVTSEDKKVLLDNLIINDGSNASIIINLVLRSKTEHYKNLNIDFLFEMLRELDEQQYQNSFISSFHNTRGAFGGINQEEWVNQISIILEDKKINDFPYLHKLFELLLYMFINGNSWKVTVAYERYYYQYDKSAKEQLSRALTCKNEKLKAKLNQFISNYEIIL